MEQRTHTRKHVRLLQRADVPVIALAGFVVVAQHALTIGDQRQPVFEVVNAATKWDRHTPDNKLLQQIWLQELTPVHDLDRIHPGKCTSSGF